MNNEERKNRLFLNKELKARLLVSVSKGYINFDEFPEITDVVNKIDDPFAKMRKNHGIV